MFNLLVELSWQVFDMDWDNWFSHHVDYTGDSRWQGGAIPGGHSADASILLPLFIWIGGTAEGFAVLQQAQLSVNHATLAIRPL